MVASDKTLLKVEMFFKLASLVGFHVSLWSAAIPWGGGAYAHSSSLAGEGPGPMHWML